MPLTPRQFQQLQDALVSAFDDLGLRELTRFILGEDLNAKIEEGPLEQRAFELIEYAERTGQTGELIRGACERVPKNPAMVSLARDAQQWSVWNTLDISPVPVANATSQAAEESSRRQVSHDQVILQQDPSDTLMGLETSAESSQAQATVGQQREQRRFEVMKALVKAGSIKKPARSLWRSAVIEEANLAWLQGFISDNGFNRWEPLSDAHPTIDREIAYYLEQMEEEGLIVERRISLWGSHEFLTPSFKGERWVVETART